MTTSKKPRVCNPSTRSLRWRLLNQTVRQMRQAFADVPADELHGMIDEALASVRKDKRRRRKGSAAK